MTRPLTLFSLPAGLVLLACAGGPGKPGDTAAAGSDQDVRGIYALTWSDTLTVRLDIGGAVQEVTAQADEVVTFNAPDGTPLELDLAAYCADPAVTCPSEAWPTRVAIDQDDPTVVSDLHTLRAWDADAMGAVVSGAVDHRNDTFLFALDGASGGSENCAALSLSLAGGTFAYPAPADTADTAAEGAPTGLGPTGIDDGAVAVGWLGVCAWDGLAVAATLSVETTYTGVRTGPLE